MVPEAALLLGALDALTERNLPARLGRLDPRDVLRVLEGVPRSFKRWSWETAPRTRRSAVARWEIENEYHVQNLLWAVLAPLFPDLNDEETLSPVGQKSPRVDLSIPSLGTVVEVKFMRPTTPFQDVIEEIAADASLYTTDPRWTSIVPFVWDDARRIEEHQKLVAGLKQLPGVIGAVVVSRPGKMDRSP
jgi:REase_DpnII-MboI